MRVCHVARGPERTVICVTYSSAFVQQKRIEMLTVVVGGPLLAAEVISALAATRGHTCNALLETAYSAGSVIVGTVVLSALT